MVVLILGIVALSLGILTALVPRVVDRYFNATQPGDWWWESSEKRSGGTLGSARKTQMKIWRVVLPAFLILFGAVLILGGIQSI